MRQPTDAEFATIRLATGPRLHYAERGDPVGEAIVFLHAYADSWFSYGRVLPLLPPPTTPSHPTSAGTGTPTSPSAATRRTTMPPMSTP